MCPARAGRRYGQHHAAQSQVSIDAMPVTRSVVRVAPGSALCVTRFAVINNATAAAAAAATEQTVAAALAVQDATGRWLLSRPFHSLCSNTSSSSSHRTPLSPPVRCAARGRRCAHCQQRRQAGGPPCRPALSQRQQSGCAVLAIDRDPFPRYALCNELSVPVAVAGVSFGGGRDETNAVLLRAGERVGMAARCRRSGRVGCVTQAALSVRFFVSFVYYYSRVHIYCSDIMCAVFHSVWATCRGLFRLRYRPPTPRRCPFIYRQPMILAPRHTVRYHFWHYPHHFCLFFD